MVPLSGLGLSVRAVDTAECTFAQSLALCFPIHTFHNLRLHQEEYRDFALVLHQTVRLSNLILKYTTLILRNLARKWFVPKLAKGFLCGEFVKIASKDFFLQKKTTLMPCLILFVCKSHCRMPLEWFSGCKI